MTARARQERVSAAFSQDMHTDQVRVNTIFLVCIAWGHAGLLPLPQGMLGDSCEGMQCVHHAAIVRVETETLYNLLAQACAWAALCVVCKRRERAMCDYSVSASRCCNGRVVAYRACSKEKRAVP